jgi:hypothetical protein
LAISNSPALIDTPKSHTTLARMNKPISFSAIYVASILAAFAINAASDLPPGTAKGSLTYRGGTAELKFAAAFVDEKDSDKPTVLILSDTKLPTEKWKSEFDMMRDKTKWNGIVFFIVKGQAIRSDIQMNSEKPSVSRIFTLKLNDPASKEVAGTAVTDEGVKDTKLEVAFHATLK